MCIEKPLELPYWNCTCLGRITADHLITVCLFTFLVCRKIKSPNLIYFAWIPKDFKLHFTIPKTIKLFQFKSRILEKKIRDLQTFSYNSMPYVHSYRNIQTNKKTHITNTHTHTFTKTHTYNETFSFWPNDKSRPSNINTNWKSFFTMPNYGPLKRKVVVKIV